MAVQKSRKTPSKRGMRRSHDSLKNETLSVDQTSADLSRCDALFQIHLPAINVAGLFVCPFSTTGISSC